MPVNAAIMKPIVKPMSGAAPRRKPFPKIVSVKITRNVTPAKA